MARGAEIRRQIRKEGFTGYADRVGQEQVMKEADLYRAALERAAYGDAGRQYGAGLGQITNYLAGAGPLADSGAATALRARLASQIYGAAAGRIGGGYADYLARALQAQRQYRYQRSLMKYAKDQQGGGGVGGALGGLVGGVGGFLLGGPPGAVAGYGVGSNMGGGGAARYPGYGYNPYGGY